MTDASALFAAIRESPRDSLPRKVFADWLEDGGSPELAAVIRSTGTIGPSRIGGGDGGDDPARRLAEYRRGLAAALGAEPDDDEQDDDDTPLHVESGEPAE